jgi:uncharacterized protein (TIGR02145 family)
MAENLNFNAKNTKNSRCYDNNPNNCAKYGRLYDWSTVMNLPSNCNSSECANQVQSRHQGICPSGWHVPSDAEWETLVNFVGGRSIAGTRLKSATGWSSSGNDTDDFGFSALPGGRIDIFIGSFGYVGTFGIWWSATENGATTVACLGMYSHRRNVLWDYWAKRSGLSLRCVRDVRP